MNLQAYQDFALLCESFVFEASTTLDILGKYPGGTEVGKSLHQQSGAPHNLQFQPVAKIGWSQLKDVYADSWILAVGDRGTAAIKFSNGSYNTLLSSGGGVTPYKDTRSDRTQAQIKSAVGNVRQFFLASGQRDTTRVKNDRAAAKRPSASAGGAATTDSIANKFKPLFGRVLQQSIADIKGMISNMIKNDYFDKAEVKLQLLKKYSALADSLETPGTPVPDEMRKAVNNALVLAAEHFYPDEQNPISRGYGGSLRSSSSNMSKLMNDIASGDQQKLSAVLAYFKQQVVSG